MCFPLLLDRGEGKGEESDVLQNVDNPSPQSSPFVKGEADEDNFLPELQDIVSAPELFFSSATAFQFQRDFRI